MISVKDIILGKGEAARVVFSTTAIIVVLPELQQFLCACNLNVRE